jgi:uncharacterized protein involved in exopolysaccharide biosynthesis
MDRVLRAIIHHPIQLLVLILLPIAIGSVVAFSLPRQYSATATLLALHQYGSLTATSVDSANLDTQAGTQVTALNELLQSQSFALDVAQEANLASTLTAKVNADPISRNDAMVTDISQHVIAQAQGSDLFTITYTGTNPQITQRVVAAVLDHYQQVIQATVASEGQKLLGTYQTQLAQAQQSAQLTAAAESDYTLAHPLLTGVALQQIPQYQHLQAQALQAQQNLQNIQVGITTLEQDITNHAIVAASLYKVLDGPLVPTQPVSRLKNLLLGTGAGVAVGILAGALFIALTVGRDRKVYSSAELRKVTSFPVVMELPQLSPKTVSVLVMMRRRPGHPLSSNGRPGK